MLRALRIRNFAVIETLDLELSGGLTVFTGETGAGKSILIEALGFLLGERGSTEWLRAGARKLETAGTFDASPLAGTLRDELGISGDTFTIRRELDSGGKSRAYLDGRATTVAALARLGERLVDFHGQHEHQTLLKTSIQLELLDGFGGLQAKRDGVAEAHGRWKDLRARLEALQISEDERLRRIDLYRFQVRDIEETDPIPGEEAELEAELPRLKNAERLLALAGEAYASLYEMDGSAEESLRAAERALEEMSRLDPGLGEGLAAVGRAREAAAEASARLARYREGVEERPERLDEIIGRQDRIARLKRKYGGGIEEVLAYRDRIRAELDRLENHGERARELELALGTAERDLRGRCEDLHRARMRAARRLSDRVMAELKDLGMSAARLSVSVEMEQEHLTASGNDRVEFLIAPNPGEPLKALRSIASGGELSRVMLALKTVLARQDRVGMLVFDEVDAGVGAVVGRAVGAKLAELGAGEGRQVFCVTHLPQVACRARTHVRVVKAVSGGRTRIRAERLDGGRRLEAVARMLGGRRVTDASLRHAKELMEST
ncbi:MAG: DNA repair protein RecN [Elusimicrobiota bacterium]